MAKQNNPESIGVEGGSFELEIGEDGKSKYISLPLSYSFEFRPGSQEGKPFTVSSVVSKGTQTIIKTSGSAAHWKLRITDTGLKNTKKKSGLDSAGNTTPPDDGENDDRPGINSHDDDWFWEHMVQDNGSTQSVILNAQKTIIIQEENL